VKREPVSLDLAALLFLGTHRGKDILFSSPFDQISMVRRDEFGNWIINGMALIQ
jgi:hypothetical protein